MLPLDLHVLSLSLAFILSQDQTLHTKNFLIINIFPTLSYVQILSFIDLFWTRTCCSFVFSNLFNILKNYFLLLTIYIPQPIVVC